MATKTNSPQVRSREASPDAKPSLYFHKPVPNQRQTLIIKKTNPKDTQLTLVHTADRNHVPLVTRLSQHGISLMTFIYSGLESK